MTLSAVGHNVLPFLLFTVLSLVFPVIFLLLLVLYLDETFLTTRKLSGSFNFF